MMKKRTAHVTAKLSAPLALCLLLAGCSHHHVQAPAAPPPPEMEQPTPPPEAPSEPETPGRGKVLYSEVGLASWYGAPYHNARAANGQVYNQNAMTAAHRTLPMGTVVRVTNLATHQSAIVTITDRGPFVHNRILDLSRAAAIKTGVYRAGVARVRVDVLRTARSIGQGGRWCVQIGVFQHAHSAKKLRDHLQRQFSTANVIEFKGATGYWVRIKPDGETHHAASEIARSLHPSEGEAYLVRLD